MSDMVKTKNSKTNDSAASDAVEVQDIQVQDIDTNIETGDEASPEAPELNYNISEFMNLDEEALVIAAIKAFSDEQDIMKSMTICRLAVRKSVTNHRAWSHLGTLLFITRKLEAAIGAFKKSLRIEPEEYANWINLGNALLRVARVEEALEAFERAAELEAGDAAIYNSIAQCYQDLGEYDKSLDALRRAELLGSKDPNLKWNRTLTQLMQGNYEEGLAGFEARWEMRGAQPRYDMDKKWDGTITKGKQVLIWSDSGFNDIIMMSRFVPLAVEKGLDIVFEIPAEAARMFQESPLFQKVKLAPFTKEPGPYEGDHLPLSSLASALGYTNSSNVPNVPYLQAPQAPRIRSDLFKVGIVWNGASRRVPDPNRVLPLRHVARLADSPNTEFYSLQRGGAEKELVNTGFDYLISNMGSLCRDLADVAAFCENLDLFITVDSYQAHIAAAMGKKVWLLLGTTPDWRWQLKQATSPWYKNIKLYRRTDRLHWDDLIEKIRLDLIKEAKGS